MNWVSARVSRWTRLVVIGMGLGISSTMLAQSDIALSDGCTLNKEVYTCDRTAFLRVLAAARTAAIETGPTDAVAQDSLKKLIAAAGKTLVARGQHADLTFLLVPVDTNGVQFTTGQTNLGSLRVFSARADQPGRGSLVWAENYTGTADTQWFAVVSRLVQHFQAEFHIAK